MAILKRCDHTDLGAACATCDGAGPQTAPAVPARKHRATYATDKRQGGYLIRVSGPTPELFVGRDVPVTMRNGQEHNEKLTRLVWKGNDATTGEPVALYKFESKPRETVEQIPF